MVLQLLVTLKRVCLNLLWKLFTVKITDWVFRMMDEERNQQSSGEVSVALAQGAEGIAGLSTKYCLIISMN
jgi:hypothetical protein